ncbi:MAG: hypothetical protein RLY83_462 [Actinomycetota bacterium]
MNQPVPKSAPVNRAATGPFDVSEVTGLENSMDFGAIKVLPIEGVEIRLEIEETSQRVVAVTLELDQSTLQLQAFAAPKNEGVWNDVRGQLASSIESQGGVAEERLGSFGAELFVKLPIVENGVNVGSRNGRFIGVDGPRWFLRGLIAGAAMTDPAAASRVEALYRSVAVDRGAEPIPPRELLTLSVPDGIVAPPRGALA